MTHCGVSYGSRCGLVGCGCCRVGASLTMHRYAVVIIGCHIWNNIGEEAGLRLTQPLRTQRTHSSG